MPSLKLQFIATVGIATLGPPPTPTLSIPGRHYEIFNRHIGRRFSHHLSSVIRQP